MSNDPTSPPRKRAKNILRIDESSKPGNSDIMNIREKSESQGSIKTKTTNRKPSTKEVASAPTPEEAKKMESTQSKLPKFDMNNEPNIFGQYRFSRASRHNNNSRLNNENLEVIYDLP